MSMTMTMNETGAAPSDARAGKYLTFQLGNEEFGIRVLKVRGMASDRRAADGLTEGANRNLEIGRAHV